MAARTLKAMIATMKIGIPAVLIRNDRLRMIFRYSCLATSHSLRMSRLLAGDDRDEDVVERRLGNLEALDLDVGAGGQRAEDVLRAGARRERHAPVAVDLARLQHPGHVGEVALAFHRHGVAREVALDL